MAPRPNFYAHLRAPSVPQSAARFAYTFHLGAISGALIVILAITGILEMFFYIPTPAAANESVRLIATEVPYGWLIRNMHFWAAQALMITGTLHLMRVIFSGGYKGRRSNWLIGMAMMLILLLINFTGFVMRWDDRANWALLVGTNLIRSVEPERTPDPRIAQGETLFYEGTAQAKPCAACHSLTGETLVGPTLQDISQSASLRIDGMGAEEYLWMSILYPNSYKVEGFENGSMFQYYGVALTKQEVEALVAFLMTQ